MPETSPRWKFREALRTKKSEATMKLDVWGTDPAKVAAHPHFQAVQRDGHFDTLDAGCVEALGFTAKMVAHIDAWPNDQKERARSLAVQTILAGDRVLFRWELCEDADEKVTHAWSETDGALIITFYSPEANVREEGDQVHILVSPATA